MHQEQRNTVYLLGTGASQAEASMSDNRVKLLMQDIKDGILNKIVKNNMEGLEELRNELADENADVEQLITLYDSSGNSQHRLIAGTLKELFRKEIRERIEQLDKGDFSEDGEYWRSW